MSCQGAEVSFPKGAEEAEVVGAEVVGAEVVGAEVSNPPKCIARHTTNQLTMNQYKLSDRMTKRSPLKTM